MPQTKILVLLFYFISASSYANLVILSSQVDYQQMAIIVTLGDGVENYSPGIPPSSVTALNVCLNDLGPGPHKYASDIFCGVIGSTELVSDSIKKGYWNDFQNELVKTKGGTHKVYLRTVNQNVGIGKFTCLIYENNYSRNRIGTSCVNTVSKPFTNSCTVNVPSLLEHGQVSDATIEGNTAQAVATVACTAPATVVFSVREDSSTYGHRLTTGIESAFTINGERYPARISVNGTVSVPLVSTLKKTSTQTTSTGKFSHSFVMSVDVL